MGDTIVIETPVATVLEVTGLQGPQGPAGASQADVLTVQGDLLYRGASAAQRLGIGTAGQILKVNSGGTAPEWGAAPAAGVSSVNGDTGAVSVTPASIDAAESNHDHQPADIYCDAAKVTATTQSAGEPNGVYFRDGSDNGKATYKSAAGYSIFWDDAEGEWVVGNTAQSQKYFIGSQDTTYPWQVSIAWTLGAQGSGTVPAVAQATLTDYQLNAAQESVSTRAPKSGNATSTEVVLGSDTRLINSRTPTAHSSTHQISGSDSIPCVTQALQLGDNSNPNPNDTSIIGLKYDSNATPPWAVSQPTDLRDALSAAASSHVHGNLTSDGKVGSVSGLPLVTTTAGAITTLALGAANTVLKVNSGGTAVEFGAAGISAVGASAADILSVSGSDLVADDPNADRIVFWDDSASKLTYAATTGGTFDGTTLRWPVELVIACSDETTNLTTGTAKVTFRAPYAFTLTGVRASVNTAPTGSTLIVDINEGGTSVLSTKLSIDASEKTSTTAASAAVISDSAIADDAEITIDIDQIGSTVAGKGLKVVLIGTRA